MIFDNFNERFQNLVLSRPWLVISLSAIFIALSSYGLLGIQQESDPRQFFSEDDPQFKYFKEVEDQYAGNEMVGFIVHPKNDQVFSRETLSVLEELTEESWTIPHSTRVDSIVNFQHTEVTEDDLSVEYLVEDAKSLSDEKIERIKQVALGEPLIINSLISEKGHVAGLFVKVQMDDANKQASEITRFAEKMRDRYREAYPEVQIYMVGTVVFTDAATMATMEEMKVTMPLGLLIVVILMLLMVKNIYLTIITLTLVGASIMAGVGLGGWIGIMFSPMVGAAPAMILTLVVANCVHILVTYQLERSRGKDRNEAMSESMRVNLQPVFLTCSTTAIGFLCLNFSDSPPFHDLGNMVALGVMVAYFLSVVLLPALVMVGPVGTYKQSEGISHKLMDQFGAQVIRFSGPIFAFMIVFVLASLWFIKDNELNDVWNEYFDETFEVRKANDFMMRELTGMNRLDFSFPGRPNIEQSVMDPEYQSHLNDFVEWAKAQPGIVSATGYSDILKRLNRDMNGGNIESFVIPDSRPLVSQYTLMYEMSLPFGLGTNNQMTSDKTHSVVSVVAKNFSSQQVIAFEKAAHEWIKQNMPGYMVSRGTGLDLIFGTLAIDNIKSMLLGTVTALVMVSALLIFALRSVKYGLLSLLPNLLPAAMTFGIWGFLVGQVGMAVSIVSSLTIGIVVDDTVHFLSKYVRAKRENGYSTEAAIRYAFQNVGVALLFTSILLTANFGILGFSHFTPNADMGILTALTIFMALVVNFLFFVPLLLLIDKYKDALPSARGKVRNKLA